RRNSSCMPPVEASRRRATSSRESTSRPPPGKIRASTVGSLWVVAIALVGSSMEPVYGGGGRGGKRNGRVSPAVPEHTCGVDQNSYLKPICADHCEMPWVKLSESLGIDGSSAKR